MKGAKNEFRVIPSVLDRLIDLDPASPGDGSPTRAESVRDLRRVVQRDLESLLNTRNSFFDLPSAFTEAAQSMLTYGLPDFSALNIASPQSQNRLRQMVEGAIRTFEPRLTAIAVTLKSPEPGDQSLQLHVDARLVIDPSPEPISFDIVLPLHTHKCEVKDGQ